MLASITFGVGQGQGKEQGKGQEGSLNKNSFSTAGWMVSHTERVLHISFEIVNSCNILLLATQGPLGGLAFGAVSKSIHLQLGEWFPTQSMCCIFPLKLWTHSTLYFSSSSRCIDCFYVEMSWSTITCTIMWLMPSPSWLSLQNFITNMIMNITINGDCYAPAQPSSKTRGWVGGVE